MNPDPATWAWESAGLGAGIFLATFGLGLVSAIVFPAGAGTLTYQLMGEQKNHWDIGFRVPGVFGPNHAPEPIVHPPDKKGPERSRVRKDVAEPAAMHY